jgi:histidyl-tRNA synthetase
MELLGRRAEVFVKRPHIFIAAIGERAQDMGFQWLEGLRLQRVRTEMDFENRSLKSQMRRADKLGASYVLIVGDRELDDGAALLRNMTTKEQEKVPLQDLVSYAVTKVNTSTVGSK